MKRPRTLPVLLAILTLATITSLLAQEKVTNRDWLEGSYEQRTRFKALDLENPPALNVASWKNSSPLTLENLKGKIVVLDFWATWCSPCIKAVPKMNELQKKYEDKGVVVIGICHPRGVDKMGEFADKHGIEYPVVEDIRTNADYYVNGYPDYYIIDRNGRLAFADVRNSKVEEVIEYLLAKDSEDESESKPPEQENPESRPAE